MPKVMVLTEFQANREQFELTEIAEMKFAKLSASAGDHVRFAPPPRPTFTHSFNSVPINELFVPIECWYESLTLPEMLDDEPIDFLHVKTKEDHWLYSRRMGLFFRQTFEEPLR